MDTGIGFKLLSKVVAEEKPYWISVLGKKFMVLPNVYSPKYFEDTQLFAANIQLKRGEEVLEIGCGTGIISIELAGKGASKVLGVDVNPDAVLNSRINALLFNLENKVEFKYSNLFEKLDKSEKFDTILWNIPFILESDREVSVLEKSICDPGYKSVEKFIKSASKYLKKDGRILICFSSTVGRLDIIEKFVDEANLTLKILWQTEIKRMDIIRYEIYECRPK